MSTVPVYRKMSFNRWRASNKNISHTARRSGSENKMRGDKDQGKCRVTEKWSEKKEINSEENATIISITFVLFIWKAKCCSTKWARGGERSFVIAKQVQRSSKSMQTNEPVSEWANERMNGQIGWDQQTNAKLNVWIRVRLPALTHSLAVLIYRHQPRSHITCVLFIVNLKSHSRAHTRSSGPPIVPPKIKAQKTDWARQHSIQIWCIYFCSKRLFAVRT